MARPLRIQQADAWYHVIGRGSERCRIFKADRDYEHFLELLERFAKRYACRISAYVLMANHFHLFLQTLQPNLSRAMQWLSTAHATWFNTRHRRSGHLFQGRFKAVLVDPDEWAVDLSRYIHLNPVRVRRLGLDKAARAASQAGMPVEVDAPLVQERITLLRSFRWSSYRAYAGYERGPKWLEADWLLARCGSSSLERRRWYREYCESAIREGIEDPVNSNVLGQVCLGSREFLKEAMKEASDGEGRKSGADIKEVQEAVARARAKDPESLLKGGGDWSRDLAMYLMRERGHPLRIVAATGGIKRTATAGMAIKRFEQRLHSNKALRKTVEKIKKALE